MIRKQKKPQGSQQTLGGQESPSGQTPPKKEKKPRGFAAMKPEDIQRIASLGGKAVSRKPGHMKKIGTVGGLAKKRDDEDDNR